MIPHPKNFCGGNFQDWLEVMLTDKCNGRCSWCIEKNGYKPDKHANWQTLAKAVESSGKQNIILLGGEPTLYRDLQLLIHKLRTANKNVYLTTNGGLLTGEYAERNLMGLSGINISIHHYNLALNKIVTGITLEATELSDAIGVLADIRAKVRFNCNLIRKGIDTEEEMVTYIEFARAMGASNVRFAELKQDTSLFVDVAKVLGYRYDLNDDPFTYGCNHDTVINGFPVNFRQMCGLQTPFRVTPKDPEQTAKKSVLYYDGKFYNGWQIKQGREEMNKKDIKALLDAVAKKKVTPTDALKRLAPLTEQNPRVDLSKYTYTEGCKY